MPWFASCLCVCRGYVQSSFHFPLVLCRWFKIVVKESSLPQMLLILVLTWVKMWQSPWSLHPSTGYLMVWHLETVLACKLSIIGPVGAVILAWHVNTLANNVCVFFLPGEERFTVTWLQPSCNTVQRCWRHTSTTPYHHVCTRMISPVASSTQSCGRKLSWVIFIL